MSGPAMTIALQAGSEGLLRATVAGGTIGDHYSNMEGEAQGVANFASGPPGVSRERFKVRGGAPGP